MKNNKRALYTGAFRFPDKDAAAFRVQGVAELFESAGYKVDFAGWERVDGGVKSYSHNGHCCFPQDEFRGKQLNPFHRLLGFLFRGHKTIRWLVKNRSNYSVVIVYNPPAIFALLVLLICSLSGVKLVLDSTEWYESDHLPGGKFGIAALENWIRMRFVYKLYSNIIVISDFLSVHFAGSNRLLIPPLRPFVSQLNIERSAPQRGILLIYAGEAGKKDKLLPIVRLLPILSKGLGVKVSLNVLGITEAELSQLLIEHSLSFANYNAYVNCLGRVSREEVMALYAQSHFSVLFRDSKRYAYAGFPTKAMESMVNGCPLITNAIGDLSYILTDENSIILNEALLNEKLSLLMQNAIEPTRYSGLCLAARSTAKRYFDPSVYQEKFILFLNSLN